MILTHLVMFHFFSGASPSEGGGGESPTGTFLLRPTWRSGTHRR